jgi:hypothetical protein
MGANVSVEYTAPILKTDRMLHGDAIGVRVPVGSRISTSPYHPD